MFYLALVFIISILSFISFGCLGESFSNTATTPSRNVSRNYSKILSRQLQFDMTNSLSNSFSASEVLRSLTLMLLLCSFNCYNLVENNSPFIPKEYQYPEDSLIKARTFVYQGAVTLKTYFIDLQVKKEHNTQYFVSREYDIGESFDSTIHVTDSAIVLNNKTVEIYTGMFTDDLLEGQIEQDTIINNGTKLGLSVTRTIFKVNDYSIINRTRKEEYLKDTIIIWKERKVECIVTKRTTKVIGYGNSDTSDIKLEFIRVHDLYYGKGIGLLKLTTQLDGEIFTFELIDIRS